VDAEWSYDAAGKGLLDEEAKLDPQSGARLYVRALG
jgi:hypothetical protein